LLSGESVKWVVEEKTQVTIPCVRTSEDQSVTLYFTPFDSSNEEVLWSSDTEIFPEDYEFPEEYSGMWEIIFEPDDDQRLTSQLVINEVSSVSYPVSAGLYMYVLFLKYHSSMCNFILIFRRTRSSSC